MNTSKLSADAQAILIFCCNLGANSDVKPLKPSEWKKLAPILVARNLRPGDLLKLDEAGIATTLGYNPQTVQRMVDLLGRSASLFLKLPN